MIIINARFLTQKMTGVQRFALEICNKLPTSIGGKRVVFIAPKEEIKNKLKNQENIIHFGRFKGQLWEQIDLPIFLKKNGTPLLINFVGIGPIFYVNKVMFLYDLAFKHHPEWFSYSFQKIYNIFIPISLKYSKAIITDSNYVKSDIQRTYNINESKINTVYAAPSMKFKNKNLEKEKFILTVSSIDPRKNLKRMIEAFSMIDTDHKLMIVGSEHKSFSKIKIKEGLLSKNIIFTGYLNDEELIDLYNKAKVFIYASLFEGFGLPPLEAQACGCPCIVSNTTSLPEVYEDSVEYCNPYSIENIRNVMNELLIDSNRRNQLEKKGLENVNRFSWDISANKFIKLIEDIV
jgi:glycosyltransferase involved in cell wall biosynthesis